MTSGIQESWKIPHSGSRELQRELCLSELWGGEVAACQPWGWVSSQSDPSRLGTGFPASAHVTAPGPVPSRRSQDAVFLPLPGHCSGFYSACSCLEPRGSKSGPGVWGKRGFEL